MRTRDGWCAQCTASGQQSGNEYQIGRDSASASNQFLAFSLAIWVRISDACGVSARSCHTMAWKMILKIPIDLEIELNCVVWFFVWLATASRYNTSRKSIVWTRRRRRRRQQQQRLTHNLISPTVIFRSLIFLFFMRFAHTLDSVWWCGGTTLLASTIRRNSLYTPASYWMNTTPQCRRQSTSSRIKCCSSVKRRFAQQQNKTHIFANDRTLGTTQQTSERMNATDGSSTSVREKRKRANTQ